MAKTKDSLPGAEPDVIAPREVIDPRAQSRLTVEASSASVLNRTPEITEAQVGDGDTPFEDRSPSEQLECLSARLQEKEEELEIARLELNVARSILLQKEQLLNSITRTLGWRLLTRFGPIKHGYILPVVQGFKNLLTGNPAWPRSRKKSYADWARLCEAYRYKPEAAASRISRLSYHPLISVVMPCYNTPSEYLRRALDSVIGQYYQKWELCICDDASTRPDVREILAEYSARDSRIRVIYTDENGGIVSASNRALELATGEFVGFLDHDDELTPDALFEVALTLQDRSIDWVYSDEDKLGMDGSRIEAFAKPAWSPDHLLSTMYTCHFSVYRTEMVKQLGGLRTGFEGSQDHDLALRISERTDRIAHIPKILYHWRKIPGSAASGTTAKPYAYDSAIKAISDALRRRGIQGSVEPGAIAGQYRVKRKIVRPGKVSVIIPTRDRLNLLKTCMSSVESKTDYPDYEIIIVDNGSREKATLDYLASTRHRVIRDDGSFNFSRLNNVAAMEASGEYLLFLNNDTEVINPDWMSAMVEHTQRPEVGAVGAKLLYKVGSIQHAGVVVGIHGVADHAHRHGDGKRPATYFNFGGIIRNYSAVTGACMMTRRDLFLQMGKFNEKDLAVSFNDIDYCLRLREKGLLIVFTPYATLNHYESATRGTTVDIGENCYMLKKWSDYIRRDPYYNPSLSLDREDFSFDYSKPEGFSALSRQELPEDTAGPFINGLQIGQYFYNVGEEVCGVAIRFARPDQRTKGTIRLHLCRSHRELDDLAVAEAEVGQINPKEGCLFLFDPIRVPGCDRLYLYLEYDGEEPGPSIWKSEINNSLLGPYYRNHRAMDGTLCFTVYTHQQHRMANIGVRGRAIKSEVR